VSAPDRIFVSRTTTQLLEALRDPSDRPAWEHLDARYRAVIAGFARRLGLNESDADEVAQQTLVEFVRAYRDNRYDRSKGRLSSWILGIAHNVARKSVRSRRGVHLATDDGDAHDERTVQALWIEERDRAILARAMRVLREDSELDDRTLLAFELVGLRGVPAQAASEQAGMSVDQVYVAKTRVTKRLRALVRELTDDFEGTSPDGRRCADPGGAA